MANWEYKTVIWRSQALQRSQDIFFQPAMVDEELATLGAQGWELVTVIRLTNVWLTYTEYTTALQYIFKRPKP